MCSGLHRIAPVAWGLEKEDAGAVDHVEHLGEKLGLVLRALSISRVALAQRLGIDKSLVGRWLAGTVHPTEHNLMRLTALIAESRPEFCMADWFADLAAFSRCFGIPLPVPDDQAGDTSALLSSGPLAQFLNAVRPEMEHRATAYEGFWRTARPSVLMNDRIFHDYGMIRRTPDGMVEVRMEGSGLAFEGWLFPVGGNVFVYLFDKTGRTPLSVLFKGVSLPRAVVLDGILLLSALDAGRTPAAVPIVLERIGDVTDDRDADLATYRQIVSEEPAPLHPLGAEMLKERLFRECGPVAAANGGDLFLAVTSSSNLSQGATLTGLVG